MKPLRCPKCRKPPRQYVEHLTGFTTTFDADNNGAPEVEGINKEGYITHVTARCGCGHSWTVRGCATMHGVYDRYGINPYT